MQLDNEKRDITESLYDIVAMRLYKLLSLLQNNDTHKFILMFLCIVVATSRNRGVIRDIYMHAKLSYCTYQNMCTNEFGFSRRPEITVSKGKIYLCNDKDTCFGKC